MLSNSAFTKTVKTKKMVYQHYKPTPNDDGSYVYVASSRSPYCDDDAENFTTSAQIKAGVKLKPVATRNLDSLSDVDKAENLVRKNMELNSKK